MDKRIIKPRKRLIEEEEPVSQTRKQKKTRKPKPSKQPLQKKETHLKYYITRFETLETLMITLLLLRQFLKN